MTVGTRIQKARKRANLSQKELGDRLGVSASMIGQYENDLRNPKLATLQKISAVLGIHWTNLADEITSAAYDAGFEEGVNEDVNQWKRHLSLSLSQQFGYSHSDIEISLIKLFSQLTEEGQQKAIERVEELTEIPKYRKENPPQE